MSGTSVRAGAALPATPAPFARHAATAALALVPALMLASPVTAQVARDAGSAVSDPADLPPPSLPEPATGPRNPYQPFAEEGITLALSYTGEGATNLTGGIRTDAAYTGQIYVGADLDMERIAGLSGGTVHAAVTNRHGKSLTDVAIGNNTSVQEVFGTQNTHLAILTYEQRLLDDRLMIEAGKSVANIHFLNSPLYCHFQSNAICGNPTFVFKNSNFTYFPASSWMAHARAAFTDDIALHVGVYEVNPERKRADDNGFVFGFSGATGVVMPWEIEYTPDAGLVSGLPGRYILGGWIDRGKYADPLRDEAGGIAILSGRDPLERRGRSGLYFRAEQKVTGAGNGDPRGLSLFGVVMTNLSGEVELSDFRAVGAVQTGTFAGRDTDTFGIMITDQRFSDLAIARMGAARVSAGGTADIARHQYMAELHYGMQLTPAIRISPNVQYIIDPDQTGAPFRTTDIPDALVLGLKFTIDGPTLLGGAR
ncbi:carbohydrate porin [uncultured Croceicoccus sp.]|uniref:carbohydrate porin n=1 Tax=uncultured Croceicoccus sp. TaxID=1295329 RepID=UPI002633E274|nr:carbohydrate porin [uncultured Croceicoccus sp.]